MRLRIIKLSLAQHQKKYCWSKKGPDEFDCSGLSWYIYNELLNINIDQGGYGKSETTKQMTSNIGQLTLYDEGDIRKYSYLRSIQPGDILFFHRQSLASNSPQDSNCYPGHCGLYLTNNEFIHASKPKGKVVISSFDRNNYWLDVLVGSKDIVSERILKR